MCKQNFSRDMFTNRSLIKITYSILGHESSFFFNDLNGKDSISLQKFRIHYFFSQTEDISSFLSKAKINIKISDGNNQNESIVGGNTFPLKNFEIYNNSGICRRQLLKVMLFNDNLDKMEINVFLHKGYYWIG